MRLKNEYCTQWGDVTLTGRWTTFKRPCNRRLYSNIVLVFFISVFNQLDAQNMFYNKFYVMPVHVSSTCVHHQEVKIALHSIWYHHTYRYDDTRGCVIQFWPPDDEHICSKHVEAWNKTYCKTFCASSWLKTKINILRCTVSKTINMLRCRLAKR